MTDKVNYQAIAETCSTLLNAGDRPTVKKIREKMGSGSYSTISVLFSRWQEQQALSKTVDDEISDILRQALLAEFGRIIVTNKQKFTEQLITVNTQLKEAQDLLADYENQIDTLRQEIIAINKSVEQQRIKLEKQLSAVESRNQDYEKWEKSSLPQIETLRGKIDALREEKYQAELNAARAETECKELQKRNQLLEQQNERSAS